MTRKELESKSMYAEQAYEQSIEAARAANKQAEEALLTSLAAWEDYQDARTAYEQSLMEGSP